MYACMWCSAGRCVYTVRMGYSFCPLVLDGFAWCDCCSILIINASRSRRVCLFFSLSPLRSLSFFHQKWRIPLSVAFLWVVPERGIEIYSTSPCMCMSVYTFILVNNLLWLDIYGRFINEKLIVCAQPGSPSHTRRFCAV